VKLLDKRCGLWAAFILRCRAAHLLPAASVALTGLLASSVVQAQGTGVLQGKVLDAVTKAPLADVVVTATSPALQGEQILVTDASGYFRVPNLPPGEYTLRFDRDNYKPDSRGGITLRLNSTITVNQLLAPEKVELKAEEVVVVGQQPTIDQGSSGAKLTLDQNFTQRIALNPPSGKDAAARSFESLAAVAPQANVDTYGVGMNGTTSPENGFVVDGISVSNPAYATLGTPLSVEFVKEVNVVSSGYMPEYGRSGGGVIDVLTGTGSNEFHGSVWFNITPGGLEGPRETIKRDGSSVLTTQKLGSLRDFGATVGGPIIKDKLWFFAGVQTAFSRSNLTRTLQQLQVDPTTGEYVTDADGYIQTTPIDGTARNYYADESTVQYIGKLTYLINQDHNITVSVYGTPTSSGGNGVFSNAGGNPEVTNLIGPFGSLSSRQVNNANDISLKYSGAFNNKKQLVDVTLGWHHQYAATLPSDGSQIGDTTGLSSVPGVIYRRNRNPDFHSITDFEQVPAGSCNPVMVDDGMGGTTPVLTCPLTSYRVGGPGYLTEANIDSWQARAVGTSLFTGLGHHVAKAGIDFNFSSYEHTKAYSGRTLFRESTAGTNYADYRQYGFLSGPDEAQLMNLYNATTTSVTMGGFVQDSWQILDKVTLNVGIRYDNQVMFGSDGRVGLALPNQWSPRVGVIYDFTQQGRSKLFANYARYYQGFPLDMADRAFPGEPQVQSYHRASACDPTDPAQSADGAACRDPANQLEVTQPFDPNRRWVVTGGARVPVDPNISAQSSDEFVLGGEYELFTNGVLGVTYTKRWINKVIEDMSRDEASTYFIGNPGYGIAKDFQDFKPQRDYDALTIYFQKAFSDEWLAQASYTLSYLRGNYAGLFRPENGQLDPGINSDFDLITLLPNRYGPLPGDRTHSLKLFGAKDFLLPGNMDIQLGLSYNVSSGTPMSFLGSHVLYGPSEVYILPRGAAGRNDWVHRIDGHLGYSVKLNKDSALTVSMDIFNIFNFQAATARSQLFTSDDTSPIILGEGEATPTEQELESRCLQIGTTDPCIKNPNFGKPTAYQAPRQFRFGAKVTF